MEDSRLVGTPIATGYKISNNDDSTKVNKTLYASMIGKLQYVVHSKPNIALDVRIFARFPTNLKENHMMEVKRILRYLKGIEDYGSWSKKSDKFGLKV